MRLFMATSMTNEHEILFVCLIVTNLPTTSPLVLTSNLRFTGIFPPLSVASRLAPAPYSGILLPSITTASV
ncbi:hypothetical protein F2Q69_00031499 [Brassica cretica]|uniref:Uncharacterized protein n=1 Tax=Brassica cretica TaxID=69181 RepID=A0A8S9S6Y5_BRACR|nr:hypothetical protein F2Q69_00031498 [Brassica cretica]KAF3588957.1 hypothetical protein F2Q69_00031499 [Brassica cretica]